MTDSSMSMSGAGVEGRYLQRDPTPILLATLHAQRTHTFTLPTPDWEWKRRRRRRVIQSFASGSGQEEASRAQASVSNSNPPPPPPPPPPASDSTTYSRAEKATFGNYVPERTAFYGSQYVVKSNKCEHEQPVMWARVIARQRVSANRCNLGERCFSAHRDVAVLCMLLMCGFTNKPPKEPVPIRD